MKKRIKQLTQWSIYVPLSILFYGPFAFGEDFRISTQADFDTHREATFHPGDNVLFERGKVFTGMLAPKAVGAAGNVITFSAFGDGAKPL